MKRGALVVLAALVLVGVAAAGRMDPKQHLNPVDNARAKAIVLQKGDFPATFKSTKSSIAPFSGYCKAADESDLTITGKAVSRDFDQQTAAALVSASSNAQLYETVDQADTSWRRFTSSAGMKCFELLSRNAAKKEGITFVSQRKLPFPAVAPRTIAVRQVATYSGIRITLDYVALQNGRAHTYLYFSGAPTPFSKAEQVRLAKVTAGRMATAMKGS